MLAKDLEKSMWGSTPLVPLHNKENIMTTKVKTTKCIDVVYMDEKIEGGKILHFLLDQYIDQRNDSFIKYIVGERGDEDGNEDEDDYYDDSKFRKLDTILKENYGLQDGEEILLLIWW